MGSRLFPVSCEARGQQLVGGGPGDLQALVVQGGGPGQKGVPGHQKGPRLVVDVKGPVGERHQKPPQRVVLSKKKEPWDSLRAQLRCCVPPPPTFLGRGSSLRNFGSGFCTHGETKSAET